MKKNTYTLGKLKKFLARLSNEQLKQKVHIVIDDNPSKEVLGHEIVRHDLYANIHDEEDCGTLKELKEIYGKDFDIKNYKMKIPAGTVFFFISESE